MPFGWFGKKDKKKEEEEKAKKEEEEKAKKEEEEKAKKEEEEKTKKEEEDKKSEKEGGAGDEVKDAAPAEATATPTLTDGDAPPPAPTAGGETGSAAATPLADGSVPSTPNNGDGPAMQQGGETPAAPAVSAVTPADGPAATQVPTEGVANPAVSAGPPQPLTTDPGVSGAPPAGQGEPNPQVPAQTAVGTLGQPPHQPPGVYPGGHPPPHMMGPGGPGRGGMMRGGMPMRGNPSAYRSGSQSSAASLGINGPHRSVSGGPPPAGAPGGPPTGAPPGNYYQQNQQIHGPGHPGHGPGFVPNRGGMPGRGGMQVPPSPRDHLNQSGTGPSNASFSGMPPGVRPGSGPGVPPGQRPPPHMVNPGHHPHPGGHHPGMIPGHHDTRHLGGGAPPAHNPAAGAPPSHPATPPGVMTAQTSSVMTAQSSSVLTRENTGDIPTSIANPSKPPVVNGTTPENYVAPSTEGEQPQPPAETATTAEVAPTTETTATTVEVPTTKAADGENPEVSSTPKKQPSAVVESTTEDEPSFDTASETSVDFVPEDSDAKPGVAGDSEAENKPNEAGSPGEKVEAASTAQKPTTEAGSKPSTPPPGSVMLSPGKAQGGTPPPEEGSRKKTVVGHKQQQDGDGDKLQRQASTASVQASPAPKRASSAAESSVVSAKPQPRSTSKLLRRSASNSVSKRRQISETPNSTVPATPQEFGDDEGPESLAAGPGTGSRLKMDLVKPEPGAKKVFLQRFAKILNQHQYYGRVDKLRNLMFLNPSSKPVQNRSLDSTVLLAVPTTVNISADQLDLNHTVFYPQVLLEPETAVPFRGAKDGEDSGSGRQVCTHFLLFEGATGRMMFAQSEQEGRRKLEQGDSCFLTDQSGLLMRSPNQLLPVAELDVVWTPASKIENASCPKHKVPLQLYNPDRKELCCALCYANSPFHQHLVVLEDVLSAEKNGGRSMLGVLEERRDYIGDCVRQGVHLHSQISNAADKKREAVNLQLDLVVASVNAKRKQLLEEISMEEKQSQSKLTGELLAAQEQNRHAVAAIETLKSSAASPTLLELSTVASARNNFERIDVPRGQPDPLANMTVSVEGLVERVQQVSFKRVRDGGASALYNSNPGTYQENASMGYGNDSFADPFRHVSPKRGRPSSNSAINRNVSFGAGNSTTNNTTMRQSPQRRDHCFNRKSCSLSPQRRNKNRTQQDDTEGFRESNVQDNQSYTSNNNNNNNSQQPGKVVAGSALSHMVDGTCVFNCPLAPLITARKTVEWRLRIDDHGDWIGVGVAVGTDLGSLASGNTMDTKHLWIAPIHFPRILRLRVNTGPNGVAKLTVHDRHGKQLDDGRIPHWSTFKSSFPQISFGKVKGKVTMLEEPKQTGQTSSRVR